MTENERAEAMGMALVKALESLHPATCGLSDEALCDLGTDLVVQLSEAGFVVLTKHEHDERTKRLAGLEAAMLNRGTAPRW